MATKLLRWQGYLRTDQLRWLQCIDIPLEGSMRTKRITGVGQASEIVRLAIDIVMRNPELLHLVALGEERKQAEEIAAMLGRKAKLALWDQLMLDSVAGLPEPEREIARLHVGLADGRPWTLTEVAEHFGFSRQRAHQLWERARTRLGQTKFVGQLTEQEMD